MAYSSGQPRVLSASSIVGDHVVNAQGEDLGKIDDLMIDLSSGRISYAVLSFGGFLGLGDKLFAVPLNALNLDSENKRFILDVDKDRLKDAPGFDKDNWPQTGDKEFQQRIHSYYGTQPYSESYVSGSAH